MALEGIEVFVKVVDEQSFSGAARVLEVSKSYVSKQISRLEDRLGARLLHRTTRKLTLTDVGRAFYERAARIVADVEEAEIAVTHLQSAPRGQLKMAIPMTFGFRYLAPLISEFMAEHPDLQVDLQLGDRKVDIVDEGFDLAVRIGSLADSSLIARKLATLEFITAASPEYLEAHGRPQHPSDLAHHQCLVYTSADQPSAWSFRSAEGEDVDVRVDGPMRANNGEALVAGALAGLGVTRMPDWMAADSLRAGRLVPILCDWSYQRGGIYAVYPHNRHLSPKVRLMVDFLGERFSGRMPWELPEGEGDGEG